MNKSDFDKECTVAELLTVRIATKLRAILGDLLGEAWQITDLNGKVLLGAATVADGQRIALVLEIEPVGYLCAPASARLAACARCVELALADEHRYRMVSQVHIGAMQADYQALKQEHQALQESERKYRELSAQLERRVEEQVELIARSQRQLYQSEKMASVGSLAAGMAHEINNPIGFIRSNINTSTEYFEIMQEALRAYHDKDFENAQTIWKNEDLDLILEDFPQLLQESISGADRIARIIANLKKYSSIDDNESALISLNDSIKTVAGILNDQMREGVELRLDLQDLPRICCDHGRINQMLLSLVQNAIQAIVDTGSVEIRSRVEGGEIQVAIQDTGCGMAPDVLQRIFDPFYTTHRVGQGTGLGLTVCADVATAHHGRITVESTPGAGSTFTIHLPLEPEHKA